MDTEKYKALLSAIETGSISAAADRLSFTPSGISRSIAALEEQLGFPLLIRGKNGVQPTKECETLLPDIMNLINIQERLSQRAALIRGVETGSVAVGTAYPLYNQFFAECIVEFVKLHQAIDIRLIEGTSSELCSMLGRHQLDMCMVSYRSNIPVFHQVMTDCMRIWVPEDHPAVKDGTYHLNDLKNEKIIQIYPGMETDNSIFMKKFHIEPNICASTSDVYAAYSMVEAGLGVALINNLLAEKWQGRAVALPLDVESEIRIGLASQYTEESSPAANAFLEFVKARL